MKLLFVLPCYFPATRFGGPIRSVHELARALRAVGDEVTVYSTNSNGPTDLDVPLQTQTLVGGVPVTYFPVAPPRGYFRSPALEAALADRARAFDLVYAPWIYAHTTEAAARQSFRNGVPVVISPRGMLDKDAIAQHGRVKKTLYLATVGRAMLGRASAIHFTSEGERRNSVKKIPEGKSFVIPNGIDLGGYPRSNPPVGAGSRSVLFLGRLSYIKGLDLIAGAWPIVMRAVPEANLVMAGPDDEGLYASVREKLERAGVLSSVNYAGMVEGAAKERLLSQCAVLLNPSYLESFGMSIVEAMAAGKPVVVTDRVHIAPDIASAGAGVVARADAGDVAEGVIRLLRDPDLAASMGRAGRALVERRYSIDATAKAMHDAFASLVGRR